MVGTTISHYKVLEKIGQGGMVQVYRADLATRGHFPTYKSQYLKFSTRNLDIEPQLWDSGVAAAGWLGEAIVARYKDKIIEALREASTPLNP